ncbi:MAG TPA: calcium-binding protein [Microvirga sp.]|jgi:Ca2+-binding RTX toxin-like protein
MALQNINLRNGTKTGGLNINTDNAGTVVTPGTLNDLAKAIPWFQYHYQLATLSDLLDDANPLVGDDIITGLEGNDFFVGSAGSDQLHGNGGKNFLVGDELGDGAGLTNLVKNGSFENFSLDGAGIFSNYALIARQELTNWTISSSNPSDTLAELQFADNATYGTTTFVNAGRGVPTDGKAALELDSTNNYTISQTVTGLVAGADYVLRFKANDQASGGGVDVAVNGAVTSFDPEGMAFNEYQVIAKADANGMINLSFTGTGSANSLGVLIDDVRMHALADLSSAGSGNDTLTGGSDADTMVGGGGNDVMHANEGNNSLYGGDGNDNMTAGNGNDLAYGGAGNDVMHLNGGNNRVDSGAGNDLITTGGGNDSIADGLGADTVYAGAGNDDIMMSFNEHTAGPGANDDFWGNAGADRFVLWTDHMGKDTVYDFRLSEGDQLIAGSGDWNNPTFMSQILANSYLDLARVDGGDLKLTFNGNAAHSLTLKWFFWNNANPENGGPNWGGAQSGSLSGALEESIANAIFNVYVPAQYDFA